MLSYTGAVSAQVETSMCNQVCNRVLSLLFLSISKSRMGDSHTSPKMWTFAVSNMTRFVEEYL